MSNWLARSYVLLSNFFAIVTILFGGAVGWFAGQSLGFVGPDRDTASFVGVAVGLLVGFLIAVLIFGMFAVIVEISKDVKRIAEKR
jgi:uncharacterized membrane protein (DUF441 family)